MENSGFKPHDSTINQLIDTTHKILNFIDILCGVPKGSILGTLLFLIFFNYIVDKLECESNLFADDTSVCESIKFESFIKINQDLVKLNN